MQHCLHNFALLCTRPCTVAHLASGTMFILPLHFPQLSLKFPATTLHINITVPQCTGGLPPSEQTVIYLFE